MCILQEKPVTHDKRAHEKLYVATFHADSTELDKSYYFREKGLPSQSPARWLIDPWVSPLSLPQQPLKQ
jgi:hypothetical protein